MLHRGLYVTLSGRLFVYCVYAGIGPPSATRDTSSVAVYSARPTKRGLALYTVTVVHSVIAICTSTVNRVYHSKAQRYAEDNRT